MPEPREDKVTDIYDRDVDDPFSTTDDPPSVKLKIRFLLLIPALGATLGRGLLASQWGFYDLATRWNVHTGITELCGLDPLMGNGPQKDIMNGLMFMGFRPQTFVLRNIIACAVLYHTCSTSPQLRMSRASLDHNFHSAVEYEVAADEVLTYMFTLQLMVGAGCLWIPEKYGAKGAYGIYCCGTLRFGRFMRNGWMVIFFMSWLGHFVFNWQIAAGRSGGVMGTLVVPLTIFGFKRGLYLFNYSIGGHDTPFKGHAVLLITLQLLIFLNVMVATASVGVASWAQALNYVIIDWCIFLYRIAMVARVGLKTTPRLTTFLVRKKMDELPSPLENAVKASGEKTAMAVFQAYCALCEGETMTVVYIMHVFFFIVRWNIIRDYEVIDVFALKSFLVVVLFTGLDFVQDLLADRITAKYSHWSYLYSNSGLFSKPFLPFLVMLGNYLGCWYSFTIGKYPRLMTHRPTRMPVTYVDVMWSPPGFIHM